VVSHNRVDTAPLAKRGCSTEDHPRFGPKRLKTGAISAFYPEGKAETVPDATPRALNIAFPLGMRK
jgi:hypothetical protein